MEPVAQLPFPADASFDGGDLDCGGGLLLLIRQHIDPLPRGRLLEIRSTDSSVEEDLPAWCRMTGNELVAFTRTGKARAYLVCKGKLAERENAPAPPKAVAETPPLPRRPSPPAGPAPAIAPLSVAGIGSWPRPRWLVRALHERLEGRLPDAEFQEAADDAVRLAVTAQLRAGVDVVTDGEQRRDNYASFVGGLLEGCQLIPLTDLLAMVDDPAKLESEMRALDVPASEVRHPAVMAKIRRVRPLAVPEIAFVRSLTAKPAKVALPGPYLLTRTMWLDCLTERAYASREEIAADLVTVLREEIGALLEAGASLVQLDEPVLTEVVFTGARQRRSFMCGALSERGDAATELGFAGELLAAVTAGFPRERLALHVCRGNWTRDESAALSGDYAPLLPLLRTAPVGTLFLELCTPRAGELEVLRSLPDSVRIGVGVVNQKHERVETVDEIEARARRACAILGAGRVHFTPDCGFATFADNPVTSAAVAEAKLAAIARAAARVRAG